MLTYLHDSLNAVPVNLLFSCEAWTDTEELTQQQYQELFGPTISRGLQERDIRRTPETFLDSTSQLFSKPIMNHILSSRASLSVTFVLHVRKL
jgi:hypothetical protein